MLVLDPARQRPVTRDAGDDAVAFRIVAERNRMLAAWAAKVMQLSAAEAADLRAAVIALGVRPFGGEAIVDRLLAEFRQRQVDVAEDDICAEMRRLLMIAEDRVRGTEWDAPLAA